MKKILKWTAIVLGGLIGLLVLASMALYSSGMQKLTQTYSNISVETIDIPNDTAAITRGKHISIIWGCTKCHGDNLSGTLITTDPIGGYIPMFATIPASNLTAGQGGIGKTYTDIDWVRAIRHSVKPNGQMEIFMTAATLNDQDLGDLIAYLKQVPSIDTNYPAISYGPIVPIAPALGFFTPATKAIDPNASHSASSVSAEYGQYLSAICVACHGDFIAHTVRNWKQADFIRTFRTGVFPNGQRMGAAMSAQTFSELSDTELSALWLYFQNPSAVVAQK